MHILISIYSDYKIWIALFGVQNLLGMMLDLSDWIMIRISFLSENQLLFLWIKIESRGLLGIFEDGRCGRDVRGPILPQKAYYIFHNFELIKSLIFLIIWLLPKDLYNNNNISYMFIKWKKLYGPISVWKAPNGFYPVELVSLVFPLFCKECSDFLRPGISMAVHSRIWEFPFVQVSIEYLLQSWLFILGYLGG